MTLRDVDFDPPKTEYRHTDADQDDLLRRRPDIALNLFHSDRDYAIANCPGATDRIVPASLTTEDLDEFICGSFRDVNILARGIETKLKGQPICVNDVTTYEVVDRKQERLFTDVTIHTYKNGRTLSQIHSVRLVFID